MPEPDEALGWGGRLRRWLIGAPRDLSDRRIFHTIALAPLLAWIGLGADGLSSSAYGPDEAFRALGEHTYLAIGLAVAMAATIFIISAAYSKVIEAFPQGGGGYMVASLLLGERWGLVSGCALLVDYVLTITISIAAAGDALFSFVPLDVFVGNYHIEPHRFIMIIELIAILVLIVLNLRGMRESVVVLTPIFAVFALTHLVVIGGGIIGHLPQFEQTIVQANHGFQTGLTTLGLGGMLLIFVHAYSMGGGTYTGLEAVSNGLVMMREPRVQNGKRTMFYMAISLAFTASGLLLLYLLWDVKPQEGKTMNAALVSKMAAHFPLGGLFALITILSEGALLVVGAQAGFAGGPRVLANMAMDSWLPRRLSALSDRLVTANGILIMGAMSTLALIYTHGSVRTLVILYSINVFITFSLSMFGMILHEMKVPKGERRRHILLFVIGFALCATILCITVFEKFHEGGWITLAVTGGLVACCFRIRKHYQRVTARLKDLFRQLEDLPKYANETAGPLQPDAPTAGLLVSGYGGLGIHTLINVLRAFPGHFKNVVFFAVGTMDTNELRKEPSVEAVHQRTAETAQRYVDLANKMGMPAVARVSVGTDVVDELEKLCVAAAKEYPRITFFAGKVIFQREHWYQVLLHNEVGYALQKRLHWEGLSMMVLPARIREGTGAPPLTRKQKREAKKAR